jgi:thiol-disulfide isomerase/thioredoxin
MRFLRTNICIWLATSLLSAGTVFAQQAAFRGTWKLDIEALAKQMAETYGESDQNEMVAMRLNRMKSMRFILNETEGVIVQEGIPNRIEWTCKPDGDAKFHFTNSVESEGAGRIAVEMTGDDRMNFLTHVTWSGGEQTTTFPLVRESTIDTWEPPPEFKIGMPAPPIVTEKWWHDPARAIDFKDGRVYLIEFWATWCGPCLQKMPRLVELQEEIGLDALGIVAITSESLEEVSGFLEHPREREESSEYPIGQRVLEMSQTISIGVDMETTTFRSYMVASEFRAIPSMFIVGKSGLVEWAGSSEEGEAVLLQVLDGSWNRDEFSKRFVGIRRAYTELPRVQEMLRNEKREEAMLLIEELEAIADEQVKFQLERIKSNLSGGNEKK